MVRVMAMGSLTLRVHLMTVMAMVTLRIIVVLPLARTRLIGGILTRMRRYY